MSKCLRNLMLGAALLAPLAAPAQAEKMGLGRPALPEEIAAWTVEVFPDGKNLPEGSGSVADGEELFSEKCAVCHGEFAEGVDNWPKLAGGDGTLADKDPLKTVGSYFPYLSTVWDYAHRSMPFGNAGTLSTDETYAIVAYILYSNDLVEDDFVLSKENFLDVKMPNAEGFIVDDRPETEYPEFSKPACMTDCKTDVKITRQATVLDVTPDEAKGEAVAAAEPAAEPAAAAADTPAEAAPAPEAPAAAAISEDPAVIAQGEKIFVKCKACHMIGAGAKNKVGPVLNGVIGRTAGTAEGFKYSPAMKDAGAGGLVWNPETIATYLHDPKGFVPKNKMAFAGLKTAEEAAAVIAYLNSAGK
ncbi:MAG: c-type cytochrome [Paenirhodobacter sp.]|uniref:c-type cytochrome n=1 Tax=Paenirhodobacter sp. TaxID=1965326 RepID=UPI003D0D0B1F